MDFDEILRLAQRLSALADSSGSTSYCGEEKAPEAQASSPRPVARLFAAFREVRGGVGVQSTCVGDYKLHLDFLEYDLDEPAVRAAEQDLKVLLRAFAQNPRRVLDVVVALQTGRLGDAFSHMDALGLSEASMKAAQGAGIGLLVIVLIGVALLVRSDTPVPETPLEADLKKKKATGTVEVSDDEAKALKDLGIIK